MHPARPSRALARTRSVGFAVPAVCATAAMHTLAGGPAPSPAAAVSVIAAVTLGHHRLARSPGQRSATGWLAWLLPAQALAHAVFTVAAAPAAPPASMTVGGHAHLHSPLAAGPAGPGHAGHSMTAMVLAHVVCALVHAVVLRHGDLALGVLLALVAAVAPLWRRRCPTGPLCTDRPGLSCRSRAHREAFRRRPLRQQWLLGRGGRVRRGPPGAAVVGPLAA